MHVRARFCVDRTYIFLVITQKGLPPPILSPPVTKPFIDIPGLRIVLLFVHLNLVSIINMPRLQLNTMNVIN